MSLRCGHALWTRLWACAVDKRCVQALWTCVVDKRCGHSLWTSTVDERLCSFVFLLSVFSSSSPSSCFILSHSCPSGYELKTLPPPFFLGQAHKGYGKLGETHIIFGFLLEFVLIIPVGVRVCLEGQKNDAEKTACLPEMEKEQGSWGATRTIASCLCAG